MDISKQAIPENCVELWVCFPEQIRSQILIKAYHALLNEQEQAKQQRFHFEHDRHRYLVTRAMIRVLLSHYLPRYEPDTWRFTQNAYGRPEIVSDDAQVQRLSFNISHTKHMIICGLCYDREIGVDTENFSERAAPIRVSSAFSEQETQALLATKKSLQQEYFFHYWTLKEAYIKARAMGLSLPLDQFSFIFKNEREIDLRFDQKIADQPSNWHFELRKVNNTYLIATCVEMLENRVVPTTQAKIFTPLAEQVLTSSQTTHCAFDSQVIRASRT